MKLNKIEEYFENEKNYYKNKYEGFNNCNNLYFNAWFNINNHFFKIRRIIIK